MELNFHASLTLNLCLLSEDWNDLFEISDENNLLVNTETFSQDVRMKLKRKAENGMQLKESEFKMAATFNGSRSVVPEPFIVHFCCCWRAGGPQG